MPTIERKGKVLLATLNETHTIPLVLEEIAEATHSLAPLGWSLDLVVIDDSPGEETVNIVRATAQRIGLDVDIQRGHRRGLGSAIIQGFNHCLLDPTVSFIVNLDADGQHDGRQIGELLRMASATDSGITIGSRWAKGGRCYGLSFTRRIVSRCSSIALRLSGVPFDVKDPTTSFRVYDRRAAELLSRALVGFNGFSFFGAGIAVAAASGLRVNETPIHFRPRVGGASNLTFKQTKQAVRDLPRIKSVVGMIKRRDSEFETIRSSPTNYTASRELELLSSTPTSTSIILNHLDKHVGKNVLEIGAGLGHITNMLIERSRSVVAVEPDPHLFANLSKNVVSSNASTFNSTLAEWINENGNNRKFDSILYVNVLEHIEDDIKELQTAAKVCAAGGKIVVFVPATPSLYGSMDGISAHFRRYRKAELIQVAQSAGLKVVDCHYFDPIGKFPYWLLYRILNRRTLGSSAVGLYDKVVIPMSASIPQWLVDRLGGKNLILVAEAA
jgi:glycosyltransferase involved in cell wall biosynthesis